MPRSLSFKVPLIGFRTCAETAEYGGGGRGTAAGVSADRARLHPEADLDAAGDAVARAGAADLLRAVSRAVDPDAAESRSRQGSGRRRRRRAAAVGTPDVVAMPRTAPPARPRRGRRA